MNIWRQSGKSGQQMVAKWHNRGEEERGDISTDKKEKDGGKT